MVPAPPLVFETSPQRRKDGVRFDSSRDLQTYGCDMDRDELELVLSLEEMEARELKNLQRLPLSQLHTKVLMKMRNNAYPLDIVPYGNFYYTRDELRLELSKREHVPNKVERKAARQLLAKHKRTR
jgi:hypothetical protein